MWPISIRADAPISVPASTPSKPHICDASLGENSSRTVAGMSPTTPSAMPVACASGSPIESTASAIGSTLALGTLMSTLRPSMLESAVEAVPEPMLASSRSASSCMSVYWVNGIVLSRSGGNGDVDDRIAVDDQGDLPVRHHRAAGQCGAIGDLGGQRAGDELVLADQASDGEREALGAAAHDHGVLGF